MPRTRVVRLRVSTESGGNERTAVNACFVVRDHNGQALLGKLVTRDKARRMAANIAKLPMLVAASARNKFPPQIKAGPATTVKDRGWTLTITTRGVL